MKFASGFNNLVHSFTGQNPFTARANRNSSGTGGINNQIVTESSLTKADKESSSHVESVNSKAYAQHRRLYLLFIFFRRKWQK